MTNFPESEETHEEQQQQHLLSHHHHHEHHSHHHHQHHGHHNHHQHAPGDPTSSSSHLLTALRPPSTSSIHTHALSLLTLASTQRTSTLLEYQSRSETYSSLMKVAKKRQEEERKEGEEIQPLPKVPRGRGGLRDTSMGEIEIEEPLLTAATNSSSSYDNDTVDPRSHLLSSLHTRPTRINVAPSACTLSLTTLRRRALAALQHDIELAQSAPMNGSSGVSVGGVRTQSQSEAIAAAEEVWNAKKISYSSVSECYESERARRETQCAHTRSLLVRAKKEREEAQKRRPTIPSSQKAQHHQKNTSSTSSRSAAADALSGLTHNQSAELLAPKVRQYDTKDHLTLPTASHHHHSRSSSASASFQSSPSSHDASTLEPAERAKQKARAKITANFEAIQAETTKAKALAAREYSISNWTNKLSFYLCGLICSLYFTFLTPFSTAFYSSLPYTWVDITKAPFNPRKDSNGNILPGPNTDGSGLWTYPFYMKLEGQEELSWTSSTVLPWLCVDLLLTGFFMLEIFLNIYYHSGGYLYRDSSLLSSSVQGEDGGVNMDAFDDTYDDEVDWEDENLDSASSYKWYTRPFHRIWRVVRSRRFRSYLRNGLAMDILACLPYEVIGVVHHELRWCFFFRLIRCWFVIRLHKYLFLIRLKLKSLIGRPQAHTQRVMFMSIWICTCIHWMACVWFFLTAHHFEEHETDVMWDSNGDGTNDSSFTQVGAHNSWLKLTCESLRECSSILSDYLNALYWSAANFAMVGCNDIIPTSNSEFLLNILILWIGFVSDKLVVATVTSAMNSLSHSLHTHEKNTAQINSFMSQQHLPTALRHQINVYGDFMWTHFSGNTEEGMLNDLPLSLRKRVLKYILSDLIASSPYFDGMSEKIIKDVCLFLRPLVVPPNAIICHEQPYGRELYFLSRGEVDRLSSDGLKVLTTLKTGDCFGFLRMFTLNEEEKSGATATTKDGTTGTGQQPHGGQHPSSSSPTVPSLTGTGHLSVPKLRERRTLSSSNIPSPSASLSTTGASSPSPPPAPGTGHHLSKSGSFARLLTVDTSRTNPKLEGTRVVQISGGSSQQTGSAASAIPPSPSATTASTTTKQQGSPLPPPPPAQPPAIPAPSSSFSEIGSPSSPPVSARSITPTSPLSPTSPSPPHPRPLMTQARRPSRMASLVHDLTQVHVAELRTRARSGSTSSQRGSIVDGGKDGDVTVEKGDHSIASSQATRNRKDGGGRFRFSLGSILPLTSSANITHSPASSGIPDLDLTYSEVLHGVCKATSFCELYVLENDDLSSLLQRYPRERRVLIERANAIQKKNAAMNARLMQVVGGAMGGGSMTTPSANASGGSGGHHASSPSMGGGTNTAKSHRTHSIDTTSDGLPSTRNLFMRHASVNATTFPGVASFSKMAQQAQEKQLNIAGGTMKEKEGHPTAGSGNNKLLAAPSHISPPIRRKSINGSGMSPPPLNAKSLTPTSGATPTTPSTAAPKFQSRIMTEMIAAAAEEQKRQNSVVEAKTKADNAGASKADMIHAAENSHWYQIIIAPASTFRLIWSCMSVFGLLYLSITIPITIVLSINPFLSHSDTEEDSDSESLNYESWYNSSILLPLNLLIDIFFLLDIYLHFNHFAYMHHGLVIRKLKHIRKHYFFDKSDILWYAEYPYWMCRKGVESCWKGGSGFGSNSQQKYNNSSLMKRSSLKAITNNNNNSNNKDSSSNTTAQMISSLRRRKKKHSGILNGFLFDLLISFPFEFLFSLIPTIGIRYGSLFRINRLLRLLYLFYYFYFIEMYLTNVERDNESGHNGKNEKEQEEEKKDGNSGSQQSPRNGNNNNAQTITLAPKPPKSLLTRFTSFLTLLRSSLFTLHINHKFLDLFKYLLVLCLVLWLLAFLWVLISFVPSIRGTSWVERDHLHVMGSLSDTFIRSIYLVLLSRTSDSESVSNLEIICSILIMLCGMFLVPGIVGLLTGVVENLDAVENAFEEKRTIVRHYMSLRNIPAALQGRILSYYDYLWTQYNVSEDHLRAHLPGNLYTSINSYRFEKYLHKFHFIHGCDTSFLRDFTSVLQLRVYPPQTRVYVTGSMAVEMCVVAVGELNILSDETERIIDYLKTGDVYGANMLLIDPPPIREETLMATDFSQLIVLSRESLLKVLDLHPVSHELIAKKLEEEIEEMKRGDAEDGTNGAGGGGLSGGEGEEEKNADHHQQQQHKPPRTTNKKHRDSITSPKASSEVPSSSPPSSPPPATRRHTKRGSAHIRRNSSIHMITPSAPDLHTHTRKLSEIQRLPPLLQKQTSSMVDGTAVMSPRLSHSDGGGGSGVEVRAVTPSPAVVRLPLPLATRPTFFSTLLTRISSTSFQIHPHTLLHFLWHSSCLLFNLWNIFCIPVRIAFLSDPEKFRQVDMTGIYCVDYITDVFFIVDLVLRTRWIVTLVNGEIPSSSSSAASSSFNNTITHVKPKLIWENYLKNGFLIDLVSSLPIDLIAFAIIRKEQVLPWYRLFKLVRFLRQSSYFQVIQQYLEVNDATTNTSLLRSIQLILIVTQLIHSISCTWFGITFTGWGDTFSWIEGDSWSKHDNIHAASIGWQYHRSLYWSLSVMSMLFQGDINPLNTREMIIMIFVILSGITVYAAFIANFVTLLSHESSHTQPFYDHIQQLTQFMEAQHLPQELRRAIHAYYQRVLMRHEAIEEGEVYQVLPEFFRGELTESLASECLQRLMKSTSPSSVSSGLNEISRDFLSHLLRAFQPQCFVPHQFIVRSGQLSNRLFLIITGSVERWDSQGLVRQFLKDNESWGYASLLRPRLRKTSMLPVVFTDTFTLEHDDLLQILKLFPEQLPALYGERTSWDMLLPMEEIIPNLNVQDGGTNDPTVVINPTTNMTSNMRADQSSFSNKKGKHTNPGISAAARIRGSRASKIAGETAALLEARALQQTIRQKYHTDAMLRAITAAATTKEDLGRSTTGSGNEPLSPYSFGPYSRLNRAQRRARRVEKLVNAVLPPLTPADLAVHSFATRSAIFYGQINLVSPDLLDASASVLEKAVSALDRVGRGETKQERHRSTSPKASPKASPKSSGGGGVNGIGASSAAPPGHSRQRMSASMPSLLRSVQEAAGESSDHDDRDEQDGEGSSGSRNSRSGGSSSSSLSSLSDSSDVSSDEATSSDEPDEPEEEEKTSPILSPITMVKIDPAPIAASAATSSSSSSSSAAASSTFPAPSKPSPPRMPSFSPRHLALPGVSSAVTPNPVGDSSSSSTATTIVQVTPPQPSPTDNTTSPTVASSNCSTIETLTVDAAELEAERTAYVPVHRLSVMHSRGHSRSGSIGGGGSLSPRIGQLNSKPASPLAATSSNNKHLSKPRRPSAYLVERTQRRARKEAKLARAAIEQIRKASEAAIRSEAIRRRSLSLARRRSSSAGGSGRPGPGEGHSRSASAHLLSTHNNTKSQQVEMTRLTKTPTPATSQPPAKNSPATLRRGSFAHHFPSGILQSNHLQSAPEPDIDEDADRDVDVDSVHSGGNAFGSGGGSTSANGVTTSKRLPRSSMIRARRRSIFASNNGAHIGGIGGFGGMSVSASSGGVGGGEHQTQGVHAGVLNQRVAYITSPWVKSSQRRNIWGTISLLLLFYYILLIPFQIAFYATTPSTTKPTSFHVKHLIFGWIADAFFIADIILRLTTFVRIASDGTVLYGMTSAKKYMKSWQFTAHLIQIAPVDILLIACGQPVEYAYWFRLTRLIRIHQLSSMWKHFEALLIDFNLSLDQISSRLIKIILWFLITTHLMACLYFFTGWYEDREVSWLFKDTVKNQADLDDTAFWYIRSLWWVSSSAHGTSGGRGRYPPTTTIEIFLAMFLQILSATTDVMFIGTFTISINSTDASYTRFDQKLKLVKRYLEYRHIPLNLRKRILDYYNYMWNVKRGVEETQLLCDIPFNLKSEILVFRSSFILTQVPLFAHLDIGIIRAIAIYLRSHTFPPNEYVVEAGQTGEEMYFIESGTVEVIEPTTREIRGKLHAGSFFGELSVLQYTRRTMSVRTYRNSFVDLFILHRADFERVMSQHTALREQLLEKVHGFIHGTQYAPNRHHHEY